MADVHYLKLVPQPTERQNFDQKIIDEINYLLDLAVKGELEELTYCANLTSKEILTCSATLNKLHTLGALKMMEAAVMRPPDENPDN